MENLSNASRGELLSELVFDHARVRPSAVFLRQSNPQRQFTYPDLISMAAELCSLFASTNVKPGGSVALVGNPNWLFHPLLIACAAYGSVLVPIDGARPEEEVRRIMLSACPRLVIGEDLRNLPNPNGGQTYVSTSTVIARLLAALTIPTPAARLPDRGRSDSVLLMPYSLGMTGRLSGVMLTHENLIASAQALARLHSITADDVIACVPPFHHILPIVLGAVLPMYSGASVLWSSHFTNDMTISHMTSVSGSTFGSGTSGETAITYWREIDEGRATTCVLKPTMMAELLALVDRAPPPPRALRFALCGGGVLTKELWRRFEEHFSVVVHQGYGLSEATGWVTCTAGTDDRNSVGRPLDCEIRIHAIPNLNTDQFSYDRRHVWRPQASLNPRPGPLGEIQIKGRTVMAGYYKNPKGTQDQLTNDNYLRTGDIGFIDDQGHLHFVGRIKETIVRNGRTIYPRDIDRVLEQHELVAECKTIGLADINANQRVIACCVPDHGDPAQFPIDVVRAWLEEKLSADQLPDRIVALAGLPRSSGGGVSIATLRGITSGRVTESIVDNLARAKYAKAPPSDFAALKSIVDRTVVSGQQLRFVCFWGAGHRDAVDAVDKDALQRLAAYLRSVEVIPALKSRLTLLLHDVHARVNRVAPAVYERYHREIEQLAGEMGFLTMRMSELWRDSNLSLEDAITRASSAEFIEYFNTVPIRDQLIAQATKYSRDSTLDPELQARNYLASCLHEHAMLAQRFADHVFLTYTMPDVDLCLPELTKCYVYSSRKWNSSRPWFSD